MAEDAGQSKTQAPTQHRRDEARQQGRVALSGELNGALVLLATCTALWLGGDALGLGLSRVFRACLHGAGVQRTLDAVKLQDLAAWLSGRGGAICGGVVLSALVVGVGVNLLQVGFQVTPQSMQMQWQRLSPVEGWGRLVSGSSAARGIAALLKLCVVGSLTYWVLSSRGQDMSVLSEDHLFAAAGNVWDTGLRLAMAVAAGLVLIGVADYGYQWWRHEQELLMTVQEFKEEMKREEGDPAVRARIRRLQRERSQKRMMEDVPRASVIVTNPTHLAVALEYQRGKSRAPKVVAKGAGEIAKRIVKIARDHAVPVVERKPLAQALFKAVAVGKEIPAGLYYAVAEVLAYVYRLRATG